MSPIQNPSIQSPSPRIKSKLLTIGLQGYMALYQMSGPCLSLQSSIYSSHSIPPQTLLSNEELHLGFGQLHIFLLHVSLCIFSAWSFPPPASMYSCCAVLCLVTGHVQLFVTPWTVARQASLSMEFSRQEYWSGLPCPTPGDLPNSRIKQRSPALQVDSLPSKPPGKPQMYSLIPANPQVSS